MTADELRTLREATGTLQGVADELDEVKEKLQQGIADAPEAWFFSERGLAAQQQLETLATVIERVERAAEDLQRL